jgi:hypothetical protein
MKLYLNDVDCPTKTNFVEDLIAELYWCLDHLETKTVKRECGHIITRLLWNPIQEHCAIIIHATKESLMKPNIVTVDTIDGKGIEVDLNEIKDELSLLSETPDVDIPKEFNGEEG